MTGMLTVESQSQEAVTENLSVSPDKTLSSFSMLLLFST